MSRVLFLHVGQPKTGTTHLQAVLTANRGRLAAAGVHYPVYGDDAREIDPRRMVPCGNGRHVLMSRPAFAAALEASGTAERVLFSSELMFNHVCEGEGIGWLPAVARDHGFTRTQVLCLLRDPLSFAVSEWQQRIKGDKGETRPLDDYVRTVYDGPARALRVVQRLGALAPAVATTLLRYETVLADPAGLEGAVTTWLDLPATALDTRPQTVVNRSLTRSEAELQRQLNLRLGRSSQLFAFPVTVDVPDVSRDVPRLGAAAAHDAVVRLRADVTALNELLEPPHRLVLPDPGEAGEAVDPAPTRSGDAIGFAFSADQLAVLAAGVAEQLEAGQREARPGTVVRRRLRSAAGRARRAVRRLRHRRD